MIYSFLLNEVKNVIQRLREVENTAVNLGIEKEYENPVDYKYHSSSFIV